MLSVACPAITMKIPKMAKIVYRQIAIIMKIPKMAKIVYGQMPTPREVSQQIPAPGQKLGCKTPGWGKFLVQIPGDARGGWLWMKLIPTLCLRDKPRAEIFNTL